MKAFSIVKSIAVVSAIVFGAQAQADGFKCEAYDQDLNVKVYNQTQPDAGTRNAAVMVVSDPSISDGRKTIATFEAGETLTNSAAVYKANVDLRFNNSGRQGELIAGTKLGQLKTSVLDVDFTFSNPLEAGEEADAVLKLVKRNGDRINVDMLCTRYLKN